MNRTLLLSIVTLAVTGHAGAQSNTIQLSHASRIRCANLGLDEAYIAAERRFGFDSSYVEFLQGDADWAVTPLSSRRFSLPLAFLFDAVGTGDGMVCTGVVSGNSTPFIYKVNNDGSLGWSKSLVGMQFVQTRIAKLFADGSSWYGYTNADSFGGDGMYRVESETTGLTFTIEEITTAEDLYFRFYEGTPAGNNQSHILCGAGTISGSGDTQALLGHFDEAGATWIKQYALTPAGDNEEAVGVCRAGGVNYACAMNAPASPTTTDGYVMRIAADGTVLGCTRITGPQGIFLASITELPDGTLLVAGSTNFGMGVMLKLSATGSLIWARTCPTCSFSTINAFHRNGQGDLFGLGPATIYGISADGTACGFADAPAITASTVVPTVTTLTPVNNASPAVSTAPLPMLERTAVNTSDPVCIDTNVEDHAIASWITAFPVPTDGMVQLGEPGRIKPSARVVVRDASGRVVFQGTYGSGMDLSATAPGVYAGEVPDMHLRFRLVRE